MTKQQQQKIDKVNRALELMRQGRTIKEVYAEVGYSRADKLKRALKELGYVEIEGKWIQSQPKEHEVTKAVTDSYNVSKQQAFKDSDIDILYKIIEEYKLRHSIRAEKDQGDKLVNRNIRVYEKHYKNFANYCKQMNVTQADMLKKAIDMLLNS